jgi:outer membrane receptor protein involved in Fe transport
MKILIALSLSILFLSYSQFDYSQTLGENKTLEKEGKVTGTIIDGSNGQPFPYASVAVYNLKDNRLVTGALSSEDGSFTIENLPYGQFYIEVTFIGYKKQKISEIDLSADHKIGELGKIKINVTTTNLKEVEIVGNTPPVVYQIDKKVVNIDQNITASGGTVADALQNAPSVQSDAQGNITLRGSSNFTVLIDGRPSPIAGSEALQQIPANLVQNVEIITNPSAKYEAEGSAGIINIVMKKQKIQGESGMVNVTAGTGNKYSANVNLNYKISRFNFSLGLDYTNMQSPIKNNLANTDTLGQTYLKKQIINGTGSFHRQGFGLNGGIDYAINDRNSITLTASLGNRSFNRPLNSKYQDEYINLLGPTSGSIYYLNSVNPEMKRNYKTLNLDYILKLDNKGQQISASVYYSGGPNDNVSNLVQDTTDANWNSLGKPDIIQQTEQNSNERDLRTKLDYVLPIGDKGKIEAGYLGRYFNSNANYQLLNYLENNWVEDSSRSDKLNFKDQTQAGYFTFSNSMSLFDYQLGLRAEYENRTLYQETLNKTYSVNRIDLFPTLHLTRQLPWDLQIQASYTRRVNHPQMSSLDPFIIHLDPQTIRQGNAVLLPEFANSFELNLEKKISQSSFISVEGFLRQTSNLIQQISTFNPSTQITSTTFSNIDHDRSMGVEIMAYLEPVKWFSLNTSVNIFNYHMFGTPIPAIANTTNTWNIRFNPTFHVSKQTTIQVSYAYNAPTITAQGTRSGYYFSTVGIKQALFKQKASLTLQMRDLIGQTIYTTTTESPHQYRYSNFQRESKIFMLTFSYHINNYKVKPNRQTQDDSKSSNEDEMESQGL